MPDDLIEFCEKYGLTIDHIFNLIRLAKEQENTELNEQAEMDLSFEEAGFYSYEYSPGSFKEECVHGLLSLIKIKPGIDNEE